MIPNAHDALFRETFCRLDAVQTFIQHFLPKPLAEAIDLESLEFQNAFFVDEEMGQHFADAVWFCRLKKGGLFALALLFEHKSKYQSRTVFQVMRYHSLLEELLERAEKEPIPVFPCVLYHGRQRWKVTSFEQFFTKMPIELRPFFPNYWFHLVDLGKLTADEIIRLEGISLVNAFFLLRFGRDKTAMQAHFEKLANFVERIKDSETRQMVIRVMATYLENNKFEKEEIMQMIKSAPMTLEEMAYRFGPSNVKARKEGKKEGKKEGRENALKEFIQLLMDKGMDVDQIVDIMRMPKSKILDYIEQIQNPVLVKKDEEDDDENVEK